jgi:hypothetical protein
VAVTRVQSASASAPLGLSTTVAFASAVVAGNTLLVILSWPMATGTGSATVVSVTDTQGNSYTAVPNTYRTVVGVRYDNVSSQLFAATAKASGACSVTATITAASPFLTVSLHETTPAKVDAGAGAIGTSATPSAGSLTPSANGAFLAAACIMDNGFGFGSGWFTPGAGWTLGVQLGGGNASNADEYQAQATAAGVTGDFGAVFPGISGPWAASLAVLVPPPTGGGGGTAILQPATTLGRELTIDTPLAPQLGAGSFQ